MDDLLLKSFFVIWAVIELFLIKWVNKIRPEKKIIDKYDYKIQFLSHLPFGKKWTNKVNPSDLDLLISFQKRIRIWWLSLVIPLLLLYLYMGYIIVYDYIVIYDSFL
jgi:hypothetical protein